METISSTTLPEVIFIEWRKSNLVWYKDYYSFIPVSEAYWVSKSLPEIDDIFLHYTKFFYSQHFLKKAQTLESFGKLSKLQILKEVNEMKGMNVPVVAFATLEAIMAMVEAFQDDFPRPIQYKVLLLDPSNGSTCHLLKEKRETEGELCYCVRSCRLPLF
jgi:hypothetical protein